MSLSSLLTPTRLRALAGYSYERGDRYPQEGRQGRAPQGDGIVGVVAGESEYTVRLFTHGRELISECTCPVGGGDTMCKHAVALALYYLEPPVAASSGGPVFETRQHLDAWCTEHEVSHELAVSADVLLDAIAARHPHPNLPLVLRSVALRDVGSLEGAGRFVGIRALQRPTAEAAREYLERAAADVRVALDEEKRPRSERQRLLAALWSRLVDLRTRLRETASPRSRATRAPVACSISIAARARSYGRKTRSCRSGTRSGRRRRS